MSYAVRKDGLGWRAVNSKDDLVDGEFYSEDIPQLSIDPTTKRDKAMLEGSTYTLNGTDYKVSFTKDDGDGMVQVKNGFDLGLESTVIHFDSGTKMPISSSEFLAFAKWFVTERNKFFIEA